MLYQFLAIFSLVLPDAVAWAQESAPMSPEKERAVLKQQAEEEARTLPVVKVKSPAELVRFSVKDNHLHIHTSVAPNDAERVRYDVPGMSGIVVAQIRGERTDPTTPYLPEMFMLTKQDYTRPDAVVSITHISINASQVAIACDTDYGNELANVQMHQSGSYLAEGEDMVHFRVDVLRDDAEDKTVNLHLSAPNIVELVRRYPTETSQYLEPIFNEFGQADVLFRVNEQTAWQVLGGAVEPPAEAKTKVLALLKQLDAEEPQARESAAAELKTMGQSAALVLMRQDRSRLSEEQKTQLDTFLAAYKPLPEEEAARMREDPKFLLLCLGAEDAQLRKLALEQLRKVTKQQIEFDVNADPRVRSEAVAALRAKLITPAATSRPALSSTQPSKAW